MRAGGANTKLSLATVEGLGSGKSTFQRLKAGAVSLEYIVVVVVGNNPGEQIKPGGCQDFEKMLEAGVPLSVFYGANRAPRSSTSLASWPSVSPVAWRACSREGRHPLRRSDVELIVMHDVTEVRSDRSHISSVPDPRHNESRRGN